MPAPIAIAPIAWKVAQLGAVAAVTFYVTRRQRRAEPRDIWRETTLNSVDEGLEMDLTHGDGEARADMAGKFRRGIRLGSTGPGIEVELASLTRFRLRKI